MKFPAMLIAAALLSATSLAATAAQPKNTAARTTMFKCKDAQGRVYYSDKPGPECGQGSVEQLTRQGTKVVPRQAAVNQAGAKPAGEKGSSNAEQRRRDKALLATYSTEGQIEEAKQRNLALPLEAVKQAEAKQQRAQKDLGALHGQAESYASQKKQIPASLIEDVRSKETQLAKLAADTERKRAHAAQVEARFEADKKRFLELNRQAAR